MRLVKNHPFLLLILMLVSVSWVFAQETTSEKGKSATRTITGCLSQGEHSSEFNLTAQDGSTWEVRSSAVSLKDHVGHEIEATGVVSHSTMHNLKEDSKDAATDAGMKKDNHEHGHMEVTDVKMVSHSCK